MRWRGSLLPFLLLLLSLQPLFSEGNPDPVTMTESEIYEELSMISGRQLKRWEMLETGLPQLQLRAETLATDLETLSLSLMEAERTLQDRTSSLQSSIEGLEKEARSLKAMNIALLILTGIAGGLAAYALFS